jgi:predicted GTPase
MRFGAGLKAAREFGAAEVIDPKPYFQGSLKELPEKYPKLGPVLPAVGYGDEQIRDLEETIRAVDCDLVVIGTPIDLRRVVKIHQPTVRVTYSLEVIGTPTLEAILQETIIASS